MIFKCPVGFKPMLAKDGDPANIKYPVAVQKKLDGIRATVVNGSLVSRTLKEIPNREIFNALSTPLLEGLDGELIVGDPTAPGCMQRTSSFVMSADKTGVDWAYYVFDKWNTPSTFLDRFNAAVDVVNYVCDISRNMPIYTVLTRVVNSIDELNQLETDAVEAGWEGVIVRTLDEPYKFGRSGKKGPLLKIKRFVDFEAEVIGAYEEMHNANEATINALGHTERSSHKANKIGRGTLGGLTLRTLPPSDPDNPSLPREGIEFNCGTGFTHEQRFDLWRIAQYGDDPDGGLYTNTGGLNGRIVKVKSFPVGVKDRPRHPVFLGWRHEDDL